MIGRLAGAVRRAADSGDEQCLRQALDEGREATKGEPKRFGHVINAQDDETDLTALMMAAAAGHTACCSVLVEARADLDLVAEDAGNRSALHFAAYSMHAEVVALLLAAGADAGLRCSVGSFGGTARELVAQRKKEWLVGGGDGEEDAAALDEIVALLDR
eukprot:SRR837773.15379.p1 GENE.SRR837773.15379~~SRR837773.15379.p1  ORF type:complete len:173 (-),score=45.93 SRR837773.15379:11-490(-)